MINKLSRYVSKDLLKTLVPAFFALALIMILGFCMQLLHEGLDVVRLPGLIPQVFIYCIPLILPPAFLTAVITVFGRLAADNELIAMRAAGVRLHSVIIPVLLLGFFFSTAATVFHFEAVPYARRRIQKLKYRALKQILLDKIALSSRSQFSFGQCHLTYEAYRGGSMIKPTLLETQNGRVNTIIKADSGEVTRDPQKEEFVLFKLHDTVITRMQGGQFGGRGRMRSDEVVLPLQVTPDVEKTTRDVKYKSTLPLLRHLFELGRELAGTTMPDDPNARAEALHEKGEEVRASLSEVKKDLERSRQEIRTFQEQKRPRMKKNMSVAREKREEILSQIESLKAQEKTLLQKIQKLQKKEKQQDKSYGNLKSLQDKLRSLRASRDKLKKQAQKLRDTARRLHRKLESREEEIKNRKIRLKAVEKEKTRLREELSRLQGKTHTAEKQHDYRSAKIRIHKRLTMAWSLFMFALVGIPLGMMCRRHSLMLAFGACFAIVIFLFYPFLIAGQIMAETGALPVSLAMWSGNITIALIGLALMAVVFRR